MLLFYVGVKETSLLQVQIPKINVIFSFQSVRCFLKLYLFKDKNQYAHNIIIYL